MSYLITIALVAALGIIVWQDVGTRLISLWAVLLVLGLAIANSFQGLGWSWSLQFALFNLLFFAVQLTLLYLYFRWRKGDTIQFTQDYIGWGDILFLVPLAFSMPPWSLWSFYVVALIAILVIFLIYRNRFPEREPTVPLAGGLAFCWIIFLLI